MSSKPHALYIAWGFPPSRGSGVPRALATANGLVDAGFDVTVLTCDRETFLRYTGADTDLEAKVHPDIDVVRVPFEWPLMDRDIRRWERARARNPLRWRERRPLKDQRDFPETNYGPWRKPLVKAALSIHRHRPIDLTVATANPNVDIEAAHQLYLRAGVPYVMDQRDAWTLNTFDEVSVGSERVHRYEAEFIRDAQEVWFVNEPIRRWHAERHPAAADRMYAVFNGYDADLAPLPRLEPPPADKQLVFAYLGTITPVMPMAEFYAGWAVARERSPEVAAATAELWGYLGFFSGRDDAMMAGVKAHESLGVRYCGPVPRSKVRGTFEAFDVMLLIVGSGRFITTGKIFDYMASGLPIVSIHTAELDAARILADYPLWFPALSLDPEDIAEALAKAAEAARKAGPEQRERAVAYASSFDRINQLRPRMGNLRAVVDARRTLR